MYQHSVQSLMEGEKRENDPQKDGLWIVCVLQEKYYCRLAADVILSKTASTLRESPLVGGNSLNV